MTGKVASEGGGCASFGDAGTQLHAVRAAGLCGQAALYAVGADFELEAGRVHD